MMSDKLITEQVFSVYFAPDPVGDFSGAINGQVTFGGLPDSSLYSGSMHYVPLLTSGTASVSDHQTLKSGSVQPNAFTLTHNFFSHTEILGYSRQQCQGRQLYCRQFFRCYRRHWNHFDYP
jgi:hypothetical protein